ncbi:MAG: hypothetical protein F4Y08_15600 [Caldilineaceae bacterium SB0662_bin_9]|uniref:PLD phosphodiesterase domain-containing protein n=1 Tax=Caldilineaceae bacterium SB0662_bin_9 TaxID=2605258 RepID=A0A6B1DYK4_9CHLR|nr:hypothetical protein [Caldilineaceae bacterium SB0662_bin_9]
MWSNAGNLMTCLCANAHSLVIAAPYIKADALSRILTTLSADASLMCVTKWTPRDIAVGASDVECRNLVLDFGGSFRLHPSLHAKYYRIDDVTLIGSANLTSSALGWSKIPNLEILCRAGDDFDSPAFQRELLKDARELSESEFLLWKTIAKVAINTVADDRLAPNFPYTWRPATRDPKHLELSYHGRADLIASTDEQSAAQSDLRDLMMPSGLADVEFRNWATTCLLATPFTNSVLRLSGTTDVSDAHRSLAHTYDLSVTVARRDMETVQNWLAFLAPDLLLGS